ncbi:MAG: hypothetical protein MHM6MM_003361 [Cercozoa sp. M6MM]
MAYNHLSFDDELVGLDEQEDFLVTDEAVTSTTVPVVSRNVVPVADVPPPVASGSTNNGVGEDEPDPRGHVQVQFFTIAFKTGAVLTYLFGLGGNYVMTCVVTILLLAADFWTVKNVSGRRLVGLRWWSQDNAEDTEHEAGGTKWIFEAAPASRKLNGMDEKVFWTAIYVTPLVWMLLGFLSIMSPTWLPLVGIALALSWSNAIGYYKCSKDQKQRLQGAVQNFAMRSLWQRFSGNDNNQSDTA